MLITQFRKFTPSNIAFVCVIGLLLCVVAYFKLADEIEFRIAEPLLYNVFIADGAEHSHILTSLSLLVALAVTLLQALYLNRVSNLFKLYSKPNFLAALMYITLASAILPFLVLSPVLISNFIQIWMFYKILKIYHLDRVYQDTFEIGMLVAIGSLIYFPFVAFFLVIWVALAIFRPFSWREWLAPLLGFGTVFFWVWVVLFWFDRADIFSQIWNPLINPDLSMDALERNDYFILIPVAILLLLFLNSSRNTIFKRIVHVRKAFQLMLFMLVVGILSFGLDRQHLPSHFITCVPVLAIYSGYYFHYAEKKWIFESLYGLLILTIVYLQVV